MKKTSDFFVKLVHQSSEPCRIDLRYASVVGDETVGFVLHVGELCVDQGAYAEGDQRHYLITVECDESLLKFLALRIDAIPVVGFSEEVPRHSVSVAAEFADNDRSVGELAELYLLEVYVT